LFGGNYRRYRYAISILAHDFKVNEGNLTPSTPMFSKRASDGWWEDGTPSSF